MSPDAQRDHDVFGFAYFEHVEEIFKWDKKKVDELHKANTPLLRRPDIPDTMHPEAKCKVMVMHDYRGNYLDSGYESTQGAISPRKDYVMEYWQRVEVFNYFTHHRVSIPPPAWINTAHRNGTRILGTFTIEGYKEDDEGRVLETWPGTDRYKLAEALVDMAKCYGFDGWLMNFETVFVKNTDWNDGASLLKLLGQVRVGLEEIKGKIIW
jgi:endo-beta-N-acetylglucosaminidase D